LPQNEQGVIGPAAAKQKGTTMKSLSFIVGNTESCPKTSKACCRFSIFFEQQESNTDPLFDVSLHLQAPMK
jgi:hypothetical protein